MSVLKINIDSVKQSETSITATAMKLSSVNRMLSSIHIDSRIASGRGIGARIASTRQEVQKLDTQLHKLGSFIQTATDVYGDAENRVRRMVDEKKIVHILPVRPPSIPEKDNSNNIFKSLNDFGKYATTAQSAFALSLVLSGQIKFDYKKGNKKSPYRVIHTAAWIKGKGKNELFKKIARRIDKAIRNPNRFMKGIKWIDDATEKITRTQLLGLSKSTSFQHWVKTVIVGIDKGTYGIKASKIPGMIAKRLYPLNAGLNIGEESWALYGKYKQGNLQGKDIAVAGANVVIKTGAAGVGAIVGGVLGTALGPAGTAIGSYIGGAAGAWIGDGLADFTEKVIEDGVDSAVRETSKNISNGMKKGFKWVKGLFK